MSRKILWMIAAGFLLLCAGFVVAQMALDVLALNETSMAAESQELQGVQGADETTMVVQKTKMRKNGDSGRVAALSLDRIHKEKLQQYRVINGALDTQRKLYGAQRANDASAPALAAALKQEIPQAQAALKKLRSLTDDEVLLIKTTTKDQQAIRVAEASYSTWKSAVDHLREQPLTESEMKARNDGIRKNSETAVSNAHEQAKQVQSEDLAPEDKETLKTNVVGGAKDIFANMQKILNDMQSVMSAIGGIAGPAGIDTRGLQGLSGAFQGVANQMQGFLGNYGPFAQTVGALVGEQISVPVLSIPDFSGLIKMGAGGAPVAVPSVPSVPSLPRGTVRPPF